MNIGLTIPTKNRVEKIKRLVESVKTSLTPNTHTVYFCLGLNINDSALKNYLLLAKKYTCENIKFHITYLSKWKGLGFAFNCISKRLPKEVETITMFGDDMIIPDSQKVFNKVEETLMKKWAPDHIGVVCFNDATPYNFASNSPIAINGFVHRNWYNALGYFIPGEFVGDYSDNWLADIARSINRFEAVKQIKIPHLHVTYNPSEHDKTASDKLQFEKTVKYEAKQIWQQQVKLMPQVVQTLNSYIKNYGK
jgi:hypothetical protein